MNLNAQKAKTLRRRIADLLGKARGKEAEVTDDLSPDAARRIEAEHSVIIDEAERAKRELAKAEGVEPIVITRRVTDDEASAVRAVGDRFGVRAGVDADIAAGRTEK
jgi:hypothetical protein